MTESLPSQGSRRPFAISQRFRCLRSEQYDECQKTSFGGTKDSGASALPRFLALLRQHLVELSRLLALGAEGQDGLHRFAATRKPSFGNPPVCLLHELFRDSDLNLCGGHACKRDRLHEHRDREAGPTGTGLPGFDTEIPISSSVPFHQRLIGLEDGRATCPLS